MDQNPPHILDIELGPHDIQALNGADAVAAFFARLGYSTDVRMPQTPENLGIAAESTTRPIQKIDLIADQESLFQVYLFELTSVTVGHTRALARAFRNRAGNYLLILTSDYERLDFVLLEKYLPVGSTDGSNIGQKQVGVRPRVLTVERRKPDRVHLRVLRRLTWTESDPFAQYDKLLSAYAIADWSEEFFNNRALFSDYYLGRELVDELFDLKVLDPAMGSGHFLVEAVDYITDKALDFLNAFPWNPAFAHLARMRETILQEMDEQGITIDAKRLTDVNLLKRHVLKRCTYGVDLNPMAVE
ncbi:MAG: hypothetical protein HYZ81_16435 [Nitrospinae bacterium]|nr:hypothetical protein [Nitrospinota bacterium]